MHSSKRSCAKFRGSSFKETPITWLVHQPFLGKGQPRFCGAQGMGVDNYVPEKGFSRANFHFARLGIRKNDPSTRVCFLGKFDSMLPLRRWFGISDIRNEILGQEIEIPSEGMGPTYRTSRARPVFDTYRASRQNHKRDLLKSNKRIYILREQGSYASLIQRTAAMLERPMSKFKCTILLG